jgi:glycosyltransferase involved in cell wall biosynthesis
MKIVHAAGWYFPDSLGGTEVYVRALARRMRDRGHEVLVTAPASQGASAHTRAAEGIRVFRFAVPMASQGSPHAARELHRWLEAERPDVVHFHTFLPGLGLDEVVAARAAGARIVATAHTSRLGYACQRGTLMHFDARHCDGVTSPKKCAACALQGRGLVRPAAELIARMPAAVTQPLARLVGGRAATALSMSELIRQNQLHQTELLRLVSHFVVLTDWAAAALVANGAPRDRVVVNRLGVSQTQLKRKNDVPTAVPVSVAYVGRFEPVKGVFDLARAILSLPRTLPFRLELRGPSQTDADRAALARLKVLLGADPRVQFAAAVEPDDIGEVLARHDVVCCPSRCHEGGPTVGLEAMAAGTPVIAAAIGGLAETVEDGRSGRLVPPGDWRALARAIHEVCTDPAATIDAWRPRLPRIRTMDDVADEYLVLYGTSRAAQPLCPEVDT